MPYFIENTEIFMIYNTGIKRSKFCMVFNFYYNFLKDILKFSQYTVLFENTKIFLIFIEVSKISKNRRISLAKKKVLRGCTLEFY